jgi:hypothetical protein
VLTVLQGSTALRRNRLLLQHAWHARQRNTSRCQDRRAVWDALQGRMALRQLEGNLKQTHALNAPLASIRAAPHRPSAQTAQWANADFRQLVKLQRRVLVKNVWLGNGKPQLPVFSAKIVRLEDSRAFQDAQAVWCAKLVSIKASQGK